MENNTLKEIKAFYADQGYKITPDKNNLWGRFYWLDGQSYTLKSLKQKYLFESK